MVFTVYRGDSHIRWHTLLETNASVYKQVVLYTDSCLCPPQPARTFTLAVIVFVSELNETCFWTLPNEKVSFQNDLEKIWLRSDILKKTVSNVSWRQCQGMRVALNFQIDMSFFFFSFFSPCFLFFFKKNLPFAGGEAITRSGPHNRCADCLHIFLTSLE